MNQPPDEPGDDNGLRDYPNDVFQDYVDSEPRHGRRRADSFITSMHNRIADCAASRRLQEGLDREFRQALAGAIEGTGLYGRGLDKYGMWDEMAGLLVPDAPGGWWVACGLVQDSSRPSALWETFLWAVYRSDTENDPFEGSCPLDVRMTGDSARSGPLLAALTVAAITGSEAFTRDHGARKPAAAVQVSGVDFAVPGDTTIGTRYPSWAEAVSHARGKIQRVEYKNQVIRPESPDFHPRRDFQEGDTLVVYTRAFVDMRVTEPVQDRPSGGQSGCDGIAARWEVFRDGTVETS